MWVSTKTFTAYGNVKGLRESRKQIVSWKWHQSSVTKAKLALLSTSMASRPFIFRFFVSNEILIFIRHDFHFLGKSNSKQRKEYVTNRKKVLSVDQWIPVGWFSFRQWQSGSWTPTTLFPLRRWQRIFEIIATLFPVQQ